MKSKLTSLETLEKQIFHITLLFLLNRDDVLEDLEDEIRSQVVEACMAYITAMMDHYGSKVLFHKIA